MKAKTAPRKATYETTNVANLLRNTSSGRYWGRFFLSGKARWVNLDTDSFTVAKLRLADERATIERSRLALNNVDGGTATMGELIRIYRDRLEARQIGESTRTRYLQSVAAIQKTWPDFAGLAPGKVTVGMVENWRNRIRKDGTGFILPGAKGRSERIDGSSASSINKVIDCLRAVLNIAVERGQLASNPLAGRGIKLRADSKKPKLPDSATLTKIFEEIEKGSGNANGANVADFCRFIACTGCRLAEARAVTWADVDFEKGILFVRGTKTAAANREVPLIPAARSLLERLYAKRQGTATDLHDGKLYIDPRSRVLAVGEASKSLVRACTKVGAPILTHHDLRDAFATKAIEAGVDIPTVAAWLGHADGGALLMRVYAHHRRPHSLAQAAKIQF